MGEAAEMYLFDTDVITNVLKPKPSQRLIDKLSTVAQRDQFISTITLSEIVYGAMKSQRPEYHLKNLEQILLPSVNIIGFDAKAAYICGQLRAKLEKAGQPLPLADLEIASIAVAGEFILVSGNSKHFKRIADLKLENWFTENSKPN
jgi:tRNA(fMet)-specific endonuclease VapC